MDPGSIREPGDRLYLKVTALVPQAAVTGTPQLTRGLAHKTGGL